MWTCKHCGETIEDSSDTGACWNCGYSREGTPPEDPEAFAIARRDAAFVEAFQGTRRQDQSQQRYRAVPFVSGLLRFCAWVVALFTVGTLVSIPVGTGGQDVTAVMIAMLGALTAGGIVFGLLLAALEGLRILRDTEENTRLAASSQHAGDEE